ncbi:hypothetical protein GH714_015934 [Hevea brasiliensis]|uniref:peroxidase n=1 Tax=Hevea brasiliensis TaxID=3981 RepID=A0A6A6KW58_HEVBR|nr:hypothetical protein GH714_015934 [Hevea brasiliensis]
MSWWVSCADILTLVARDAVFMIGGPSWDVPTGRGHTIGIGHCSTISVRLYNFTGKGDTDPSLDPKYAATLNKKCKPGDKKAAVEMYPGSFTKFDEDYYSNVSKRRGLFQSDAALLDDGESRTYVQLQSHNHGLTFARDFGASMIKMGYVGVLTGNQGEIRKRCAFVNLFVRKWKIVQNNYYN